MSERSIAEVRRHQQQRRMADYGLLFGFFGGIFAWIGRFTIGYILVRPACVDATTVLIHLSTVVFAVIAAAATWSAWRAWKRTGETFASTLDGYSTRVGFMALFGIFASAFSLMAILTEGTMAFIVGPCQR